MTEFDDAVARGEAMARQRTLQLWTIYRSPADFPDVPYVLRNWLVGPGGALADGGALGFADTLEEARSYLRTLPGDAAPANAPMKAPASTPYDDYVAGPVATNTFWAEIDDVVGSPGAGETLSSGFFKPSPPYGVGMFCAQGDEDSYAEVTVSRERLKVNYKNAEGEPVLDVNGSRCGPYLAAGSR